MIQKVFKTIEDYSMFSRGDKVIVAVSGGPDSMCLLHILYTFRKKLGIELVAAHLNHCLRGEDADADQIYVKKFCENIGVEFYSKSVDINAMCKEKNISCEMAGREARYDFFYELKNNVNAQKIAVAHNANDQAETVIMRIMRGTGLNGLVGIKPVRDDLIVRPIINLNRREIEAYCKVNDIVARIDKTNLENIYSRNKIRLELIPYIEKNFNEDIVNTMNRFVTVVSKDNDYLEQVSKIKYTEYCYCKYGKIIINKELFREHEAILTRVVRGALLELKGDLYNFETKHIYDIIQIQKNSTGKRIMLPEGIIVSNSYGDIHIYNKGSDDFESDIQVNVNIGEKTFIKELDILIKADIEENVQSVSFRGNNMIKYFDYDKLNGKITLRNRKEGDRFTPLGMCGSKKLKDMLINLKVPKEDRNKIPLVCFGESIAWIVGYRVSQKFKVDKDTKKILKLEIKRGE